MKKARNRILRSYNWLIATLMAMLGFASSCEPVAEYGVPTADFIVNGNVTSEETGQPIRNIRVSMQGDTSITNADGTYQVIDRWGFPTEQTYEIQFSDVDGETNGEFIDLDTIVQFKNPEFSGGDGDWYSGKTSKEFNVKLKPKK